MLLSNSYLSSVYPSNVFFDSAFRPGYKPLTKVKTTILKGSERNKLEEVFKQLTNNLF